MKVKSLKVFCAKKLSSLFKAINLFQFIKWHSLEELQVPDCVFVVSVFWLFEGGLEGHSAHAWLLSRNSLQIKNRDLHILI